MKSIYQKLLMNVIFRNLAIFGGIIVFFILVILSLGIPKYGEILGCGGGENNITYSDAPEASKFRKNFKRI